jgi:hypothetical protein
MSGLGLVERPMPLGGTCGSKIRLSNNAPANSVMRRAGGELSSMLTADFEQFLRRRSHKVTDQP